MGTNYVLPLLENQDDIQRELPTIICNDENRIGYQCLRFEEEWGWLGSCTNGTYSFYRMFKVSWEALQSGDPFPPHLLDLHPFAQVG